MHTYNACQLACTTLHVPMTLEPQVLWKLALKHLRAITLSKTSRVEGDATRVPLIFKAFNSYALSDEGREVVSATAFFSY